VNSAVIFDVDGVLLDLTTPEEDAFFLPFERRYGLTGLSRDWDSYLVRNDEHIVAEILEHHSLPAEDRDAVMQDYVAILAGGIANGAIPTVAVAGASDLLQALTGSVRLGVATANLLAAAKPRLQARQMWQPVAGTAFGAEGSGHKRETVARAIAATGLPKHRIVYIGDNLNDLEAGLANGVHFIGFSADPTRRETLHRAGAQHLSGDHATTRMQVAMLLA
jgi:phosphoglycolate phosphatase-like HAD superfamily hydrolase